MKPIRILYVENTISRHKGHAQQFMAFFTVVEHLAYDKLVEIHWAGEDDYWRVLKAEYHSAIGQNYELWQAQAMFYFAGEDDWLPGDVQFALHYRAAGKDHWDNNQGRNYAINADSGIRMPDAFPLLNLYFQPYLHPGQKYYPLTVAVRHALGPRQVYIRWTTDHWRTMATTPCFFRRKHWDKAIGSNARNPNRYGCGIWISQLNIDDAYRLEYAIACETDHQTFWDNNFGKNYVARRERLKILTLNLHCYQEENQDAKFWQIAKAINDLNIDIVCLQEVAEPWNDGRGDWNANAAKIIRERLWRPYHLHADWSHLGFGRFREGTAILSKYDFIQTDAGYVSASRDPYDIHARKVVMAQVYVPYMGPMNIFSAHVSWWSDGFREQFEQLRRWANEKHAPHVAATFLCGDFNIKAGSEGYGVVAYSREYDDQFLKICAPEVFGRIFGALPQAWDPYFANDGRIDYIWLKRGSSLEPVTARVLFTDTDYYGRVSDHCGYYVEFEPRW